MSQCCGGNCESARPQLVRLPDGNALPAEEIRSVRAYPRINPRDGKAGQSASVRVWLTGLPQPLAFPMPHGPAAEFARDAILEQLGVPPFPEYVGPGEDAADAAAVDAAIKRIGPVPGGEEATATTHGSGLLTSESLPAALAAAGLLDPKAESRPYGGESFLPGVEDDTA